MTVDPISEPDTMSTTLMAANVAYKATPDLEHLRDQWLDFGALPPEGEAVQCARCKQVIDTSREWLRRDAGVRIVPHAEPLRHDLNWCSDHCLAEWDEAHADAA